MFDQAVVTSDRKSHWIQPNHQNRIPPRWVSFDTEARSETYGNIETQSWSIANAVRWRFGLKSGDQAEYAHFNDPMSLWQWVANYCRPQTRTVCVSHNLGYDVRISQALTILPKLGFSLEWCNLDSNVSSMTWRSDRGTLVFSDLWTWLPTRLHAIGTDIGLPKLPMPQEGASAEKWSEYCQRDAEIVYHAMSEILDYIRKEDLGNWQPTGAGMAYAVWRHKFMTHKVLVHDDEDILTAERTAMHTGRAEAWRHGTMYSDTWTDVDMRNAYVTIASQCDLPCKLKYRTGAITNEQYHSLRNVYRCLVYATASTNVPTLPCRVNNHTVWPVGRFTSWWWDTEINTAIEFGAKVHIHDVVCYTRAPVMARWAEWVLGLLSADAEDVSPVVRTWVKHCGRALIGRISLRTPTWEAYAANPFCDTGIVWETNADTGETYRLMAIGDTVFRETERREYKDSLPQITGWIMAECRSRLWHTMHYAGLDNLAHVDTDGLLVNSTGLRRLKTAHDDEFDETFALKGSYNRLTVYGPRNYRPGNLRKTAGVPKNATEEAPNSFLGVQWHGLATDLEAGNVDRVTLETRPYHLNASDPRRHDAPGVAGGTVAIQVYQSG